MIVGYVLTACIVDDMAIITAQTMHAIAPDDPLFPTWPRTADGIAYTWDISTKLDGSWPPTATVRAPGRIMRALGSTFDGRRRAAEWRLHQRLSRMTTKGIALYRELYPDAIKPLDVRA